MTLCFPQFHNFDVVQNYRRLAVWRKAHAIALNLRALTERIPCQGNLGLIDQLRRASLSIPEQDYVFRREELIVIRMMLNGLIKYLRNAKL